MAISLTHVWDNYNATTAGQRQVFIDAIIVWDSSYPTGGEALTTAIINAALVSGGRHSGCTVSAIVNVVPGLPTDNSLRVTWDSANSKLMAYVTATEVEVGNGVDLSAVGYKTPVRIVATKTQT